MSSPSPVTSPSPAPTRSRRSPLLVAAGTASAPLRVLPDYLLVGGKRCGTTSLQHYLVRHPAVRRSHSGKGTHYFDVNYSRGPTWFRAHFPTRLGMALQSARAGTRAVTGEASPYYSYHPAAMARIAAALPDVRLIFVARDPVERAYSHYRYEVRGGFETLDVHAALDREQERLAGEEERLLADPTYVSSAHVHHSYQSRGLYADQLERMHQHVPADRVLVLRFDELFGDLERQLARVFAFLGLPAADLGTLPRLEQGDGTAVPADVRARLEDFYAAPNERLREAHGIDFRR